MDVAVIDGDSGLSLAYASSILVQVYPRAYARGFMLSLAKRAVTRDEIKRFSQELVSE